MSREYLAMLIGGLIALVLRAGDVLLKYFAHKLGVDMERNPDYKNGGHPPPKDPPITKI